MDLYCSPKQKCSSKNYKIHIFTLIINLKSFIYALRMQCVCHLHKTCLICKYLSIMIKLINMHGSFSLKQSVALRNVSDDFFLKATYASQHCFLNVTCIDGAYYKNMIICSRNFTDIYCIRETVISSDFTNNLFLCIEDRALKIITNSHSHINNYY